MHNFIFKNRMDIERSNEQILKQEMSKNEYRMKEYQKKNYREINAEATLVEEKSV